MTGSGADYRSPTISVSEPLAPLLMFAAVVVFTLILPGTGIRELRAR